MNQSNLENFRLCNFDTYFESCPMNLVVLVVVVMEVEVNEREVVVGLEEVEVALEVVEEFHADIDSLHVDLEAALHLVVSFFVVVPFLVVELGLEVVEGSLLMKMELEQESIGSE